MPIKCLLLKNAAAYRCNVDSLPEPNGQYIRIIATNDISPIDGQNTATLQARVYLKGGTGGSFTTLTSGEPKRFGGSYIISKSYVVEIKITDYFNIYSYFVEIPTGLVLLHGMDQVAGAGVGKYCEHPGYLDIVWPIKSEGYDVITRDTENDHDHTKSDITDFAHTHGKHHKRRQGRYNSWTPVGDRHRGRDRGKNSRGIESDFA